MKPWLLNILACPIDKHHPLNAYFFTWETSEEEMQKLVSEIGLFKERFEKNYRNLVKQLLDGTISPQSIRVMEDRSASKYSKLLFSEALKSLDKIEAAQDKSEDLLLKSFQSELDALHCFFNLVEVESGLLVCSKCERWYPVGSSVETIPELLPDDLREKDKDIAWLSKWRKLIPVNVVENGRPFNLK